MKRSRRFIYGLGVLMGALREVLRPAVETGKVPKVTPSD